MRVCLPACMRVSINFFIMLCSYFQPGVVDKDGCTPLRLAVQNWNLEVVNYLIVKHNVDLKGMYEQLSIEE